MRKPLAVIFALVATPISAQECNLIIGIKPVTISGPNLGPWPVLVGATKTEFDYDKRRVCLINTSNPMLGVKVMPERFCFDMSKDKYAVYTPIVRFANGLLVKDAGVEKKEVRKVYDHAHELCLRPPEVVKSGVPNNSL